MLKGILVTMISAFMSASAMAHTADETDLYLNAIIGGEIESDLFDDEIDPMSVQTLAVRNVGPTLNTYSANVANCAEGLSHVRILVTRAAVKVHGGGANFSNGDQKNVNFNRTFSNGYTSPWLSTNYLGANGRCVKSVYVKAQAARPGETSRVEVQGRYTK